MLDGNSRVAYFRIAGKKLNSCAVAVSHRLYWERPFVTPSETFLNLLRSPAPVFALTPMQDFHPKPARQADFVGLPVPRNGGMRALSIFGPLLASFMLIRDWRLFAP